jgi:hypothetical protein
VLEQDRGPPSTERAKYTFTEDDCWYKLWHFLIVLDCLYTSLVYPHYTMNGFPPPASGEFWTLLCGELLFAANIFLNFFKQEKDEDGTNRQDSAKDTAWNYLHSEFTVDLVALLPMGYLGD